MRRTAIWSTICIVAICALTSCASSIRGVAPSAIGESAPVTSRDAPSEAAYYFKENPDDTAKFSMLNMTFYGDTRTSRAFTWYTDSSDAGSDIRYTAVHDGVPNILRMRVCSGKGGVAADQEALYWHKAVLDDLQPGVEYRYQIGDSRRDVWGSVKNFRMPDTQDDFIFLFVSDTHIKNEKSANVAEQTIERALKTTPDIDFVVHGGDFVSDAKDPEQWRLAMETFQSWMPRLPIVAVTGNHDNGKGIFSRHFHLPAPQESNPKSGAFYSFRYGPAHFVVLNTNESSDEYAYLSEKQAEWMRDDVASARENGARWIFVVMHRGPYSVGENATQERISRLRESLPELLDELRVDMVLQGHDHIASRTKPLQNGAASAHGTVYLNVGPAGRNVDELNEELPTDYLALFDFWTRRPNDQEYQNFCTIHVSASGGVSGILYETYRSENAPVYVVDKFKLPSWSPVSEALGDISGTEPSSAS